MGKRKYSEEFIRRVLKEHERGAEVSWIISTYGISEATFYRWRARAKDLRADDTAYARRALVQDLELLKRLYAEALMTIQDLRQENARLRSRLGE